MNTLIYNGKSFADFETYTDFSQSFSTPEKDVEIISIPGRNGDLSIFNNRFMDQEISFPCYIRKDFIRNFRQLTQWLNSVNGYQRLETSKEPEYFRDALFLGAVEPTPGQFTKDGHFTIKFRMHPQRWLKSSLESIDVGANYKIFNPTNMPAKPLIRFVGNGEVRFVVDSEVIGKVTVTNNTSPSYVDIDCETYDAYSVDGQGNIVNRNADVTFDSDPYIPPGECSVPWTIIGQGAFHIYLTPRFFDI